jgi:hypothetical protein
LTHLYDLRGGCEWDGGLTESVIWNYNIAGGIVTIGITLISIKGLSHLYDLRGGCEWDGALREGVILNHREARSKKLVDIHVKAVGGCSQPV